MDLYTLSDILKLLRIPLETANVIEQADIIGKLRAPLKNLLELVPAGTNHTTRILNTRSDAGRPRKRLQKLQTAAE